MFWQRTQTAFPQNPLQLRPCAHRITIVFGGQPLLPPPPPPPPPEKDTKFSCRYISAALCCCRCCCHIYIISFATHRPLPPWCYMCSPGGKLLHAFINKNYARLLICRVIAMVRMLPHGCQAPCGPRIRINIHQLISGAYK